MPDLNALTTKMAKDKGYAGGSPTDSGIKGFVCPRANAYGGRDGIIPPGVAAEHGLVPRSMHHISIADTAKAANAAREDGKTEADRYREYYGQMAPATEPDAQSVPAASETPSNARTVRTVRTASTASTARTARTARTVRTPPSLQVPDAGMFSPGEAVPGPDDTLDGFYEELRQDPLRTADELPAGPVRPKRPPRQTQPTRAKRADVVPAEDGLDVGGVLAGLDFGREEASVVAELEDGRVRRLRTKPASSAPALPENDLLWRGGDAVDLNSPAYRRMAEELAQYKKAVSDMTHQIAVQADEIRTLRLPRTTRPSETVRVVLAQEEQKLKIGGEAWECRILGALNRNHTGDDIVLSVSDPRYAAELLSELRPGPVSILSGGGRTDCAYRGNCVKIYGEADSPDFITLFRFTLSPDGD